MELFVCVIERIDNDLDLYDAYFGKILVQETKMCYRLIDIIDGKCDKILNAINCRNIKKSRIERQRNYHHFGPNCLLGHTRAEAVGQFLSVAENELYEINRQISEIIVAKDKIKNFGQEKSSSNTDILYGAVLREEKQWGRPKRYLLGTGCFKVRECPKTYKLSCVLEPEKTDALELGLFSYWTIRKSDLGKRIDTCHGAHYAQNKKELVEPVLRECESKLIELRKQKDNYQMLVRKISDFLMEDKESVSLKYAG